MRKIMYLKEQKGNVLLLECDVESNSKFKAYVNSFKINSKITNIKFKEENIIICLSNNNVIVLENIKLLKRKELKNIKKAMQNEILSRISKKIMAKTKLTLNRINPNINGTSIASVSLSVAVLLSVCISKSKTEACGYTLNNSVISQGTESLMEIINDKSYVNLDVIDDSEIINEELIDELEFSNNSENESQLELEEENSENESQLELEEENNEELFISEISTIEESDSSISTDIETINNEVKSEDEIIRKYADMYFINYEDALKYVNEDIDMINEQKTYELGVIRCLKNHHWDDDSIDKTPIVSEKTLEEKIEFILEMANVYGIYDEDILATIYGVVFAETGGTSYAFIHLNNCGGVMEGNSLARCKTFEIGAERFVRTFLNIKNIVETNGEPYGVYYNPNLTLEENMVGLYNGASQSIQENWVRTVAEYKEKAINSGILDNYTKDNKVLRKS